MGQERAGMRHSLGQGILGRLIPFRDEDLYLPGDVAHATTIPGSASCQKHRKAPALPHVTCLPKPCFPHPSLGNPGENNWQSGKASYCDFWHCWKRMKTCFVLNVMRWESQLSGRRMEYERTHNIKPHADPPLPRSQASVIISRTICSA